MKDRITMLLMLKLLKKTKMSQEIKIKSESEITEKLLRLMLERMGSYKEVNKFKSVMDDHTKFTPEIAKEMMDFQSKQLVLEGEIKALMWILGQDDTSAGRPQST